MHLRTRVQHDELNRNHRSHCSQVQPSNNSLQESPIPTNSNLQSDHSPQPFFYPSSLQPRKQAIDKCVDLKSETIQLLGKLKQWLRELCLTQACSQDVAEQLEPIIQQITEAGQTSEDSVWADNFQLGHRGQRSMLMRDSKNIYVSSGVQSQNGHGKHQSVLIHEEGPEVSLLNQSQKNLVRLFFKRYTRLLENCLARIGRCTGEKKLKFLVETTMRNIFGQTLRVSYDLKIVEHRLREERRMKADMNRTMNIRLLKDRLQLLFLERGEVKSSFQLIRAIYSKGSSQDAEIVSTMMAKMSKLAAISQRKTRTQLQRITFSWRKNAHQMKVQQDLYLVEQVRMQIHEILGQLASAGQTTSQFGLLWRGLVQRHVNYLLEQLFPGQDCLFLSLQDILHERLAKREKQISIIDFMEDQQYGGSSHRSQICKQHPFLNEFTIDELKNCILSGQIYRSEKTSSSLLLLPIKPASGIVFACLAASNSQATASFSRSPMTLHSFRLLLRIVELITPLLQDLSNMCQRVEKGWREVQKNSHYELLYRQYLKIDLARDNPVGFDGHLQVEHQSEHEMAIDSHRLQVPNEVVGILMQRFSISNLMVYHCTEGIINQQPCIVCGDVEAARSQQHIIQSIYRQLLDSGKDLLAITRSNRTFNVLPLRKDNKNVGLIHMTCQNQEKIDYYLISECLVPLILKFEGAINCSECQVSLKLPLDTSSLINQQQMHQQIEENPSNITLNNLSSLVSCDSLIELETHCNSMVKSQGNLFHKIIYRIDMNDAANYYSLQPEPVFLKLKETERITHQEMFIEEYSIPTNGSSFTQLVFTYPVFPNPQLHIYQHEQTYPFRLLAFPIKNETQVFGYFLIGHYISNALNNDKICDFFRNFVNCLAMNANIFKSIRLDDQQLNKQFRIVNQQASRQIEGSITTLLKEWRGKGRIIEQFKDLSEKITTNQIMSSKNTVFSLMKVDRQSRDINCLMSTRTHLTQVIAVPEEIFNIIEQTSVLSTHEKLQASQCKLKTQNINRTIRPMKANYLHNANIFFPNLPQSAKGRIIESIKSRFQLEGWIANQNWPILHEISNRAIEKSNVDKMYFLINLGHRQSKGYLLLIEQDLLQPKETNVFTQSLLCSLQAIFSKIISRSRSYQSDLTERKRALIQLSLLMQRGFSVEQAVNKLYLNWQIVSRNVSHLCRVSSQVIGESNCQSKKYLQLLKMGFEQIQMMNLQKEYRDSIFVQKISSILNKYNSHQLLKYSLQVIDQSISQKISFSHVRASKKIFSILNNITTSVKQHVLSQVHKNSEFRAANRKVSKTTSAYKMMQTIKLINLRQSQRYFFNQVQKLYHQFSNSFQLIAEQCHKISFNTRQNFMKFANQRCMAVIDHLHFGSTVRIQILTALMLKDSLIIYRLNREGDVEEIITQKPLNLDPQFHNGYIFVSTPIDNFPNTHYLLYKITTKNHINTIKEASVIGRVITEGMVPCFANYLAKRIGRASKLCEVIMNLTCKQLWNGSASSAQGIYMFGRGLCAESQCDKLRALCFLKSLKQAGSISELKMVRNAINEQSRIYYSLQYEHNALSNALTGTPTREEAEVLHKYGQLITREKLKQTREEIENLEEEEQRKLLYYQIKSKTFATAKIVTFCQKRENQDVEDLSLALLRNKQNHNNGNKPSFEKVYVENKLETKAISEKINNQKKKLMKSAARGLWLTLSKLSVNSYIKQQKSIFNTLLLPARSPSLNRY